MARPATGSKREDIKKVHSDAELLDELSCPGVIVVDMYPHFAGPCDPMQSIFRKMSIDFGDAVRFIQAQTDHIEAFAGWRNKSCPTFSFWVNGNLVKVVKGANAPVIEKTVKEQVDISKVTTDRVPVRTSSQSQARHNNSLLQTQPDIDIPMVLRKGMPYVWSSNKQQVDGMSLPDGSESAAEAVSLGGGASGRVGSVAALATGDEYTVSIIKPDAVVPHIIEDIRRIVRGSRFEVVKEKRLWLTREQAAEFYKEHEAKPFYQDLLDYMTSGPAMALLLLREDAIKVYRDLIGPCNAKRAQEVAPHSIRALYGKNGTHNAVHGSDSKEAAKREMDFLFAEPVMSTSHTNLTTTAAKSYILSLPMTPLNTDVTATVAVITPDAVQHVDHIVRKVLLLGYEITKRDTLEMQRERAADFWQAVREAPGARQDLDYEQLVSHWSSGSITVLLLKREDAVVAFLELAGPVDVEKARETMPNCFRALYGTDSVRSGVYASATVDQSHRDQAFFFNRPGTGLTHVQKAIERTLALIKPDAVAAGKTGAIMDKITEAGFTIIMHKPLEMSLEMAQDFYKDHVGKPFYEPLTTWMSSAPIHGLILQKEDGIQAWRETMGPTNSEKAREIAPGSIRALYGTDGSQNAVHGSDSPHNAAREMKIIFRDELQAIEQQARDRQLQEQEQQQQQQQHQDATQQEQVPSSEVQQVKPEASGNAAPSTEPPATQPQEPVPQSLDLPVQTTESLPQEPAALEQQAADQAPPPQEQAAPGPPVEANESIVPQAAGVPSADTSAPVDNQTSPAAPEGTASASDQIAAPPAADVKPTPPPGSRPQSSASRPSGSAKRRPASGAIGSIAKLEAAAEKVPDNGPSTGEMAGGPPQIPEGEAKAEGAAGV
ncbi:hypothetical protein RI367_004563 [Sorochytrium milnesiophthora]